MKSIIFLCILSLIVWQSANADSCGWPADEQEILTAISKQSSTRHSATLTGLATWYSRASAQRERTGGLRVLMANGKPLNDSAMTCAMNGKPFGQHYRVTNCANGKTVIVRHEDRGPGKKAESRGVIIDLTPRAFVALGGNLNDGKLTVKVEAINNDQKERTSENHQP